MIKSFIGVLFLVISFQVLAASEAGTATFKNNEQGSNVSTRFEYLDESTSRMNMNGGQQGSDSYMLIRDGKALIVAVTQGQTMVMDIADLSNMAASFGVSPDQHTQGFTTSIQSMEATGKSETVAGIEGELYKLKWTENGKVQEDDLVVTHDAKAVAYTRAWLNAIKVIQKAGAQQEVKGDQLVAKLENENLGILRLGNQFELESIDTAKPDPAHFVAPAATMKIPDLGSLFSGNTAGSNAAGSNSTAQDTNQEASQDAEPAKSSGGMWGSFKDKFKKKSDRQVDRQTSRTDGAVDRTTDQATDKAIGKSVNKLLENIFK